LVTAGRSEIPLLRWGRPRLPRGTRASPCDAVRCGAVRYGVVVARHRGWDRQRACASRALSLSTATSRLRREIERLLLVLEGGHRGCGRAGCVRGVVASGMLGEDERAASTAMTPTYQERGSRLRCEENDENVGRWGWRTVSISLLVRSLARIESLTDRIRSARSLSFGDRVYARVVSLCAAVALYIDCLLV